MHKISQSFPRALLIVILVGGLVLVGSIKISAEAPGVVVVISLDTTWTKANSPYTLTGPIVISTGITLTINAGVTVNLNGYYFFVNGTLQAIGTASDKIQINGGEIIYGDNEHTGRDSIFENTIINSTISSSKPLTLHKNTINVQINVGANSVVSENIIEGIINAGSNTTISKNNLNGDVSIGDFSTFSHNTINGDITTGNSVKILNNTIHGSRIYFIPPGGHGYTTALKVGSFSEISNNTISGGVTASSSIIKNNVISGGAPFTDWGGRSEDSTSAVTIDGDSSVTSNIISSSTGGYGVLIRGGYTHILGNIISNGVRVAGDALIEENLIKDSGTGIRVGDIFISAFNDIDYGYGDSIIRNNIIANNSIGIGSSREGGTAIIEHNLISDNNDGISVSSQISFLNNTITNSITAIILSTSSATITYNNIINYTQNSLFLSSVSTDMNAMYNWWGITDIQAINLTIHDFKYDINLGRVNFIPLLTAENNQAPSTSFSVPLPSQQTIPEFPSWILLPLLIVATLVVAITRNKLVRREVE